MADKPLKVVVTNITDGPKIFNGITAALLHPNQETGPLEVSEAELKSMRSTGYFKIAGGEGSGDDLPSLAGKNKDQLLQIAKDEEVEVPEGATNPQIVEAIEAKRAG